MPAKKTITIENFAAAHRLKTKLDDYGEAIIPGKRGANHIFEYGSWPGESNSNTFGVMFMPDRRNEQMYQPFDAGITIAPPCSPPASR